MFTRLTPILPVTHVAEELAFYEALGLTRHTDPDESYPLEDFAAVAHGEHILFGLARTEDAPVPPAGLAWQLETDDLDAVALAAAEAGLEVTSPVTRQPWGRRTTTLRSPNGYLVGVEEVQPAAAPGRAGAVGEDDRPGREGRGDRVAAGSATDHGARPA